MITVDFQHGRDDVESLFLHLLIGTAPPRKVGARVFIISGRERS